MNKGMVFSQGGYVKPIEKERDVFPDVGEQFFWRVVSHGQSVSLELRQYKTKVGSRSSLYGARGPFVPNAQTLNHFANDLLLSLNTQQQNLKNAAKWAGDYYPSNKEAK